MSTLVRDVILRDGTALRLRSPVPADEPAIKAFFDGLAPQSRYRRFHGFGRTDLAAHDAAHADGDARVTLIAGLGDRVVAVAGYDRLNEPGVAEVAFAVADGLQGRGLGTRMLEQLAEIAAARGLTRFDAEVLADNRPMIGVFAGAGFDVRRETAYGEVHLALDIRPTERLAERIAAAELPEPPELAIVAVPAPEVLAAVTEAADAGARAVLVISTGFSDTDEPEGRAREDELLAAVRARGVRLVGPNSLGLANTDPDVRLVGLLGRVTVRPGGLALSSQSGALGLALLGHAAARRLGIASFLALGNRADVSTNDVLEHFADDDRTTVVAFYVESFGNPRRFSQVARRVSRRKPILAVKGSRPRLPAETESHTAGALGDEAA